MKTTSLIHHQSDSYEPTEIRPNTNTSKYVMNELWDVRPEIKIKKLTLIEKPTSLAKTRTASFDIGTIPLRKPVRALLCQFPTKKNLLKKM